jgi:exodeoxyribonuclease VII small subunit
MSAEEPDNPNHEAKTQQAATPARFEQALSELEQLVEQLEGGDLSLEESLERFERGVGLARECRESLEAAEQKVQMLVEQEGSSELADYTASDGSQDS